MQHRHVAGRDFHPRLTLGTDTVRVKVTDTLTERVPVLSGADPPATRWTVAPREGAPGTTVWAELDLA
ncbi:hypothetical protein ACWDE9_11380 [Streptomyces olivaceoviridis]